MKLPPKLLIRGAAKTLRRAINGLIDAAKSNRLVSSSTLEVTRTAAGTYANVKKPAGGEAAELTAVKVVTVKPDYLVCIDIGSGSSVNVSKPFLVRQTNWDQDNSEAIAYEVTEGTTDGQERTATQTLVEAGGDAVESTATERLFPDYTADDLIWATTRTFTETAYVIQDDAGADITLHDVNEAGRQFRMKRTLIKVCVNDVEKTQVFEAGEVND